MPNTFTTASIMPKTSSLFVGPRGTGKTVAMFDVLRRIRNDYGYVIGITDEADFGNKLVEQNCLNFSPSGVEAVVEMIQHAGDTSFLILFCCSMSPTNRAHLQTLFSGTASPRNCTLLIEAQTIKDLPIVVREQQDFVFVFGDVTNAQGTYFHFMSEKKFEYKMRKYVPKYSALVSDMENKVYYVYTGLKRTA